MVLGSAAIRKVLFFETEGDLQLKRSHHVSTHWDQLHLSGCTMEFPAGVRPPCSSGSSALFSAGCFVACAISRNRHQERWWLGGLILATGYFTAYRYHSCGNGVQGHISSFWTSAMGVFGCSLRVLSNSGNRNFHSLCIAAFIVNMWFDIGRFHMWHAWIGCFRRTLAPNQKKHDSIWKEFAPRDVVTEFLDFRPLHATPVAETAAT